MYVVKLRTLFPETQYISLTQNVLHISPESWIQVNINEGSPISRFLRRYDPKIVDRRYLLKLIRRKEIKIYFQRHMINVL